MSDHIYRSIIRHGYDGIDDQAFKPLVRIKLGGISSTAGYTYCQLHCDASPSQVDDILATLEALVDAGLIRAYGWSTDDPDKAVAFAKGPHCAAVQHVLNVFEDTPALLAVCDDHDLASINRAPLAMGLLGGRYGPDPRLPSNDVRGDDAPA